jgi:hypothetical protein
LSPANRAALGMLLPVLEESERAHGAAIDGLNAIASLASLSDFAYLALDRQRTIYEEVRSMERDLIDITRDGLKRATAEQEDAA